MDPNANLTEQRDILRRLTRHFDEDGLSVFDRYTPPDHTNPVDDLMRLCVLVEALDGWLSTGGFPPKDWMRERDHEPHSTPHRVTAPVPATAWSTSLPATPGWFWFYGIKDGAQRPRMSPVEAVTTRTANPQQPTSLLLMCEGEILWDPASWVGVWAPMPVPDQPGSKA